MHQYQIVTIIISTTKQQQQRRKQQNSNRCPWTELSSLCIYCTLAGWPGCSTSIGWTYHCYWSLISQFSNLTRLVAQTHTIVLQFTTEQYSLPYRHSTISEFYRCSDITVQQYNPSFSTKSAK